MNSLVGLLTRPWPWYVAGPLIGLFVPALLWLGNKQLGVSSGLRHLCAACVPGRAEFFRYDWKLNGSWSLMFLAGILVGGFIGGWLLDAPPVVISPRTQAALAEIGLHDYAGLVPAELFRWSRLVTVRGLALMVGGGFLVGFGASYAGGCTSGHAIAGLADRQPASLIAMGGFFAGGLAATCFILPLLV
jgi:hypothetical protein